jgi:hypothetical protein
MSRDSGTGRFVSLTSGRGGPGGRGGRFGGRGGDRAEREEAPPPKNMKSEGLDPFQLQLAALKAKLAGAAEPPATDPADGGERPSA